MVGCYNCGCELEDVEYSCPFCGQIDAGEGYYRCPDCDALNDWAGEEWVCEYCGNEGIIRQSTVYYDDDCCDDEYCEDGIPDVNQGWVGEHYG